VLQYAYKATNFLLVNFNFANLSPFPPLKNPLTLSFASVRPYLALSATAPTLSLISAATFAPFYVKLSLHTHSFLDSLY